MRESISVNNVKLWTVQYEITKSYSFLRINFKGFTQSIV